MRVKTDHVNTSLYDYKFIKALHLHTLATFFQSFGTVFSPPLLTFPTLPNLRLAPCSWVCRWCSSVKVVWNQAGCVLNTPRGFQWDTWQQKTRISICRKGLSCYICTSCTCFRRFFKCFFKKSVAQWNRVFGKFLGRFFAGNVFCTTSRRELINAGRFGIQHCNIWSSCFIWTRPRRKKTIKHAFLQ